MHKFTLILIGLCTVVILIAGGIAFYFATQTYSPSNVIFETDKGIALNGFDVVNYHSEKTAVRGTYQLQVDFKGSTWYFSSLENRNKFAKTPEKYEPLFGGYDPSGLTEGRILPTKPELFLFHAGNLYFFYSEDTKKFWLKDMAKNLIKARGNWDRAHQKLTYFHERNK